MPGLELLKCPDGSLLLDVIDKRPWGMTGELAKYFEESMADKADYGLEWFENFVSSLGSNAALVFVDLIWEFVAEITVVVKTIAATATHAMSTTPIVSREYRFPYSEKEVDFIGKVVMYATSEGFLWKRQPQTHISIKLSFYTGVKAAKPTPEEAKEVGTVEETPSEEPEALEASSPVDIEVGVEENPPPVEEKKTVKKKSKKRKKRKKDGEAGS